MTTDDGVPVMTPVVARSRGPARRAPTRPGRLKARRSHGRVTVRWPRREGADPKKKKRKAKKKR